MLKIYLIPLFLFYFGLCFSQTQDSLSIDEQQRRENNIQAGNPFKKFGYKPKILTLSNGKYLEFHDKDSIVQIGSFTFHVKKKKILGYILKETKFSEATLRPEVVSRWFSPDPLADEFPDWSPYVFTNNNPIFFTDPTGLAPVTIFENSITGEKVEVEDNIVRTIVVNQEDFEKAKGFASLGKLNAENFTREQFNEYSSFYDSQLYGVSFEDRLSNLGKYLADGFTEQIFDSGLKNPHADIAILEDYGLLSGGSKNLIRGSNYAKEFYKAHPKLQKFIGKGVMEIHHRIPQRYIQSGQFPEAMRTSLSNLYGLPRNVHRSLVTPIWNSWARNNPNPSQADIMKQARNVDKIISQYINRIGR